MKFQSATLKCNFCTLEISGKITDCFSAGLDVEFGSAFFVLIFKKSVNLRRFTVVMFEMYAIL